MGSHELKLDTVVSVCSTLDNLLVKSFGPNALNVLLSTASGKLMVTSAGMTILQSLNISHPIGQMLIRSIQSHHGMAGDNSKSFLLHVCEILKNIHKAMSRDTNAGRMKFCKCLHKVKTFVLPERILPILVQSCGKYLSSYNMKNGISEIISTHLQGKINHQTRDHFTQLLTNYIAMSCGKDITHLSETLQFILDNFDVIFHENPGISQLSSKSVPGIILTRDVLQNNPSGVNMDAIRFIVMGCSLEVKDSVVAQNAIFSGLQNGVMQQTLLWKQQQVRQYVQKLKDEDIKLLITTAHVSELFVHVCVTMDIYVVHCVDEEETALLSNVGGLPIVYESTELLSREVSDYIGLVDSCCNLVVGGRRCLQLVNPRRNGNNESASKQSLETQCPLKNVHSVLICAPTPGMCSQFRSLMYNAIKCTHMLTDPKNVLEPQTISTVQTLPETNIHPDHSNVQDATDAPKGIMAYPICGGGTFELFLHRCFKEILKDTDNAELQEVLKILSDSLLAVPLRLLQNSFAPSARRMNVAQLLQLTSSGRNDAASNPGPSDKFSQYVAVCDEANCDVANSSGSDAEGTNAALTTVRTSGLRGVNGRTGTTLLQASTEIVQPLASKVLMIYQVLELVAQILRIDSVVSVSKLRPESDSSDEENI